MNNNNNLLDESQLSKTQVTYHVIGTLEQLMRQVN